MRVKHNLSIAVLTVAILLLTAIPVRSATPEQIEAAINNGVAWLVGHQNVDGSWGNYAQVAVTGLTVVKLQDRARELHTSDYDDEIQKGLDYIFSQATLIPNEYIYWDVDWQETYCTGIVMMAIANDGDTSQAVVGGPLDELTYEEILNGSVNFFMITQCADGGWGYGPGDFYGDQSNSGYAVLGLSYAREAGAAIPASIVTGLLNWIGYIQSPDGGSGYMAPGDWENVLKTGNLIFQMSFLGIGPGDSRFDAAIDYIEANWQNASPDPGWGYSLLQPHYQAMYCLMKGLQSSGVDLIDTDGDSVLEDWFNQEPPASPAQDFASAIVATQQGDGSWPFDYWGDNYLATAWALLTLEKVTVIHHIEVEIDIKPETLNLNSKGVFTAFVDLPEGYGWLDIDISTIKCEGAPALTATMANGSRLIVKFDREDLVGVLTGDSVELTVEGVFVDEISFKGSDTIRVIDEGGKK